MHIHLPSHTLFFSIKRFVTWNCPYIVIQLEELVTQSTKDHSVSLLLMLELGVRRAESQERNENVKWESRDKPELMRIDWNPIILSLSPLLI